MTLMFLLLFLLLLLLAVLLLLLKLFILLIFMNTVLSGPAGLSMFMSSLSPIFLRWLVRRCLLYSAVFAFFWGFPREPGFTGSDPRSATV